MSAILPQQTAVSRGLPTLVVLLGAFLGAAIGLALGIGAFPLIYSGIRYASSWRFIVMAVHDMGLGVPRTLQGR